VKTRPIVFYPVNEQAALHIDPPQPASNFLPEWFTSVPKLVGDTERVTLDADNVHNMTVRNCTPLMDGFTSGYVFKLRCDVEVAREDGKVEFRMKHHIDGVEAPVTARPVSLDSKLLTPWQDVSGYDSLQFNWMPAWSLRTPRGWSCLFTHPINRIDLPFYTLGGVIDTDGWGEAGNHPFLLKKDFVGLIPEGTPIVQIIPFRREKWESERQYEAVDEHVLNINRRDRFFRGYYKKNLWTRKTYR
jgi:hypothetical protein